MEKYPHLQFIKANNIKVEDLPEMLRKRILGFDDLAEGLEHTTEEDKAELEDRLEFLSHELDEDLEEHFEPSLENNEHEEEAEETKGNTEEPADLPETKSAAEEPIAPGAKRENEPRRAVEENDDPHPENKTEGPLQEPSDETILSDLLTQNKNLVHPAELKRNGLKATLTGRKVLVGKFCLQRGKYQTCYSITLKKEK